MLPLRGWRLYLRPNELRCEQWIFDVNTSAAAQPLNICTFRSSKKSIHWLEHNIHFQYSKIFLLNVNQIRCEWKTYLLLPQSVFRLFQFNLFRILLDWFRFVCVISGIVLTLNTQQSTHFKAFESIWKGNAKFFHA